MKTMVGASSSATRNSSLTSFGPSPRYFCISSEPTTRRKVADVLLATALASSVLPVPGSPYRMTPYIARTLFSWHTSMCSPVPLAVTSIKARMDSLVPRQWSLLSRSQLFVSSNIARLLAPKECTWFTSGLAVVLAYGTARRPFALY